jgi:DNA-binding response OmpR family regulator
VVVADDDDIIRQLCARALPKMGYAVTVLADGLQAREHLSGHEADVLVTDIGMPGVGGMELIRWTRANRPGVRIIAITGLDTPELITACIELGACRCLAKPFTMEALGRAVQIAADS